MTARCFLHARPGVRKGASNSGDCTINCFPLTVGMRNVAPPIGQLRAQLLTMMPGCLGGAPLPPQTSMLIPAFTRGPGWCNIFHVGSWCSKGRSPSTLSPGGTGGRRTKKRTFVKEQEKWCNILHVNRTGCRGRLLATCFRPKFGVAGCFSADVDVSRASLDF